MGLTIVLNGWKDTRNRPLINVIGVSPSGVMFLKAVDCEGQVKDSKFIYRILIVAIKMVGSENVVVRMWSKRMPKIARVRGLWL